MILDDIVSTGGTLMATNLLTSPSENDLLDLLHNQ